MSRTFSRLGLPALPTGLRPPEGSAGRAEGDTGQVLWLHATSERRLAGLCDIAARLKSERDDVTVLATWDPELMDPPANPGPECDHVVPVPSGPTGNLRQFLATWRPAAAVWTGGYLNAALVRLADEDGVPMILLDADSGGVGGGKRRWFSDPTREALNRFAHVLTPSDAAIAALRRVGCTPERIERTTPLRALPDLPEGPDEEVAAVAQVLAGRPTWLAACPHVEEFALILSAHRSVLRLAHRLLLVVVLEDRRHLGDIVDLAEGMTLRHEIWHLGDRIGEETQLLIADDPQDLGLWYRIAPQTFMGHTLVAGNGRDPLEAAALGSAVLLGPHTGSHPRSCQRLIRAGAAEPVPSGPDLASHVSRLTAPDVAARMALAGWDVATEGAELTERMVTLLNDLLDANETA